QIGISTSLPFTYVWSNLVVGTYDLTAQATDNDGAISISPVVTINVISKPLPHLLSAMLFGANLIITYPASASDWTLETSPDFSAGSWTPISSAGVTNGDSVVLIIPISGDAGYFRMRQ